MTLGAAPFSYVAGSSPLHRLGAVPKLVWLAAVVAFCLVTLHPVPLLVVLVAALGLAAWSGIIAPARRALAILGPIAASVVVLQVAAPTACPGGCTVLATLGPLTITGEALGRGLGFVLRLLAMASVAVVLLVTTRPADLFGGLRRLRVPHAAALVLATTLELVPLLARELALVLDARRARGLRTSGISAVAPALVPVFVAAFERVGRLAIAMESRGYGAGVARTSYRTAVHGPRERVLAWVGALAGVVGVAAGLLFWGAASVPVLIVPSWAAIAIVAAAAGAFLWLVGRAITAAARA